VKDSNLRPWDEEKGLESLGNLRSPWTSAVVRCLGRRPFSAVLGGPGCPFVALGQAVAEEHRRARKPEGVEPGPGEHRLAWRRVSRRGRTGWTESKEKVPGKTL
jgi:hypothetical protein